MEQRRERAVLQLPVLQGRAAGQPQERLEEGCHRQHHRPRCPHHSVLSGVLCVPEQPRGQRLLEGAVPLKRDGLDV